MSENVGVSIQWEHFVHKFQYFEISVLILIYSAGISFQFYNSNDDQAVKQGLMTICSICIENIKEDIEKTINLLYIQ